MTTPMRATAEESSKDWMAAMWMAPFTIGMTLFECMTTVTESWLQAVFSPAHQHGHDPHTDLEVPDMIEEDGETDLFA